LETNIILFAILVTMLYQIISLDKKVSFLIKNILEISNEALRLLELQDKLIDRIIDIEKELN
jgi:hypothetical protein